MKRWKRWVKSLFYMPKHTKTSDDNILRLLMPSIAGSLLCMACLAGTTWAWFSAGIETSPQTITAANFAVSVSVADNNGQPVEAQNGRYNLTAGVEYTVTLTATGNAPKGGYCVVEGGERTLYTARMLPGKELEFTLTPKKAADYAFTAVWGSYSGEADIQQGAVIKEESFM